MTPSTPAAPRPSVRSAVLRWLLVSLVLTGVIAMHVLSQHDAAGGHHGSMLGDSPAVSAVSDSHDGHGAVEMAAVMPVAGAAMVMPAAPSGGDLPMTACILFLVIGAGAAVLLAVLAAVRRRIEPFAARSSASLATSIPRGPPLIGPPRISLCVLRV
ncbi:hypothetical protein ABLG96_19855 [Nakamurella sp. A5-74]|uniref:DUF2946 domain-containing protein n=1 Tax=Nakamurella sp. A5-74 TaxID=3158264 RepID=A0AAU8DQ24_9ACTN